MRILGSALALMCVAGAVQGQPRAEVKSGLGIHVLGEGSVLCGTYLKHRAERDESRDYVYFTWVPGYITGRNHAAKRVHVTGFEEAVVLAYLDKYCRDNPLRAVFGGAVQLYEEVGGER